MPDYNRNSAGSMKGMINDNDVRPVRIDIRLIHKMVLMLYTTKFMMETILHFKKDSS